MKLADGHSLARGGRPHYPGGADGYPKNAATILFWAREIVSGKANGRAQKNAEHAGPSAGCAA